MHNYKKLEIWNDAMALVQNVYRLAADFPNEERYGLTSQLKRSAISIPSNIAEGSGRNTDRDFFKFLGYANGSSCELDTQISIAKELGFLTEEDFQQKAERIDHLQKKIYRFQKTLNIH